MRAAFKDRYDEHGLQDPRIKALMRWITKVDDDRVAEAIAMVSVAMDAPRHGRWEVSRVIDDELRKPEVLFPHDDRMVFLRWIVRGRETRARIDAKLREIRGAKSTKERAAIVAALGFGANGDGGSGDGASEPTLAGGSLENAHTILAHAWRAAPEDARPKHDAHRGEAEPFIGATGTIRLAIFLARRVEHLLEVDTDKQKLAAMLELAESAADGEPVTDALRSAAKETKLTGPLGIARSACAEAKVTRGRPDMAGAATRPAVTKVVALLLEAEGKEAVRRLLSDLDDELRRLDVVHALHLKKKTPTSPIARAILRAPGLWVAELEDGRFGLLSKQGSRWVWAEGEKKDVLASVPDAHFEKAVMAAK